MNQGLHPVALFTGCRRDPVKSGRIGGNESAPQGEGEQVAGKSPRKTVLFSQERILELDDVLELVLPEKGAPWLDLAAV